MHYDYVVVGAGITGITIARVLAEVRGKVLIVDRRNHIGGNCYDEYDEHRILIHKYGPHILHTNHKEVWDFLSRFTEWIRYQHRVRIYVDGKLLPFPINLDTINRLYNLNLDSNQMGAYLDRVKVDLNAITNSQEAIVSKVGTDLFEKFFKNYTLKQWGIPAERLHSSVCERIPVRFNHDDRYFNDRYQGIPIHGYRKLFERMVSYKNIYIMLQTDYSEIANDIKYNRLIYTGPIDEYFDYCYGKLGYRSIYFDFRNCRIDSFQDVAVVNYPNDYDFTRITEYKKLTGQKAESTTISLEYPCNDGDPYYPIPTPGNYQLYKKYLTEAKKLNNIFFAGRLGTYRYINMDIACLKGIGIAQELLRG